MVPGILVCYGSIHCCCLLSFLFQRLSFSLHTSLPFYLVAESCALAIHQVSHGSVVCGGARPSFYGAFFWWLRRSCFLASRTYYYTYCHWDSVGHLHYSIRSTLYRIVGGPGGWGHPLGSSHLRLWTFAWRRAIVVAYPQAWRSCRGWIISGQSLDTVGSWFRWRLCHWGCSLMWAATKLLYSCLDAYSHSLIETPKPLYAACSLEKLGRPSARGPCFDLAMATSTHSLPHQKFQACFVIWAEIVWSSDWCRVSNSVEQHWDYWARRQATQVRLFESQRLNLGSPWYCLLSESLLSDSLSPSAPFVY